MIHLDVHCANCHIYTEQQQREAENLMASVQENIADKERNAANSQNIGPVDAEALDKLYEQRVEWLQQTLTLTVENVLEAEFEIALQQAIESMDHTFAVRVLTPEERIAKSKAHLVTTVQEKVKNKRTYGNRLSFLT